MAPAFYVSSLLVVLCAVAASQDVLLDHELEPVLRKFISFDRNEDGVLNGMELYHVLTNLDGGLGYSQSEARTILRLADVNKDNQLDVFELVELVRLIQTESLQH